MSNNSAKWASAREIVSRLGGRFAGHKGSCRCPAHNDKTPSLSVSQTRDGRVLVFCHGGCSQADVIAALKAIGLWGNGELTVDPSYPGYLTTRYDGVTAGEERQRRREAQDIWDRHAKISGTRAEAYLRARGIAMPLGDQLGYVPSLKHSPSGKSFPAMLARIADEGGFCAVQRTYLDPVHAMKCGEKTAKMTKGPMAGGAVRLFPVSKVLGLAEGIETALSAAQLYRVPVWATLSANRLAKIEIPQTVRTIMLFSDAGEVGTHEAFAAADLYESRRYRVQVITPKAHFPECQASDFNDILLTQRAA
jgi:hypothetical protein